MHVEKYTKKTLGNMLKHYSRTQRNPDCRDNIDSNLSELNYNLAPEREIGDYQFIQQRLGEVNCSIPIQRTVDKNNQGIEKLNAKTILNRQ